MRDKDLIAVMFRGRLNLRILRFISAIQDSTIIYVTADLIHIAAKPAQYFGLTSDIKPRLWLL